MNFGILVRLFFCIFSLGMFLYTYISRQNAIVELRLQIPPVAQKLEAIIQENIQMQFEVDQFESPAHLMELMRQPEFSHLKHPLLNEIIIIPKKDS